jgi:phosphonopyruvate decarboxylase
MDFCACLSENTALNNNIIAANEGNAVGIAAGYYLSTGKPAMVYMQNSGIGNAVNPLVSLADEDVYNLPMLLFIGWRGEPNTQDEPQHKKQGKITLKLLEGLGIDALILDNDNYEKQIEYCMNYMKENSKSIAVIVRKNTFAPYKAANVPEKYTLTRECALKLITQNLGDNDIIISSTGKASRELFEIRENNNQSHSNDFLTVGSMGHTSSIALGMSLFTDKNIYCIDGDGSFIMHMGAAAVSADNAGDNLKYIIINNGAHESVGGQPTVGYKINIPDILHGAGIKNTCEAFNEEQLKFGMNFLKTHGMAAMIVYTKQGSRKNLGRPTITPIENKHMLMERLQA